MKTQIKVTDTRMHSIQYIKTDAKGRFPHTGIKQVPVIDGEIILLINPMDESISDCSLWRSKDHKEIFINNIDNPFELARDYEPINPIVISRTQKLHKGDVAFHNTLRRIGIITSVTERQGVNDIVMEGATCTDQSSENNFSKVLAALRGDFSTEDIYAFTQGKMNEGDKVLVECEAEGIHDKCYLTKKCQETEGFKGTEHEGVDMCEDGCVWANHKIRLVAFDKDDHIILHKVEEKMVSISVAKAAFLAGNELAPLEGEKEQELYFKRWFEGIVD